MKYGFCGPHVSGLIRLRLLLSPALCLDGETFYKCIYGIDRNTSEKKNMSPNIGEVSWNISQGLTYNEPHDENSRSNYTIVAGLGAFDPLISWRFQQLSLFKSRRSDPEKHFAIGKRR